MAKQGEGANLAGATSTAARRDVVRAAAAAVFAARGYNGATLQEIAEALGIRKASLYYYYRTKEEILLDILTYADEQVAAFERRDAAVGGSPLERIGRFVETHVTWYLRHPDIAKVAFRDWTALTGDSLEIQIERRRRYSHFLRDHIGQCRDQGVIAQESNIIVIANFINGAAAAANIWFNPDGPDRPEAVGAAFGRMAIATVLSAASRPTS